MSKYFHAHHICGWHGLGDCFEVAMNREKYPEKIPFRLTRMLVNAMEVSGIEGSYRSTCERTMSVLRDNRDSLIAMLEAFVYDPLISWRLLGQSLDDNGGEKSGVSSYVKDSLVIERPMSHSSTIRSDHFTRSTNASSRVEADIIDKGGMSVHEPIREEYDEDSENDEEEVKATNAIISKETSLNENYSKEEVSNLYKNDEANVAIQASYQKSLKMYSEIKSMVAKLSSSFRIASITGGQTENSSMVHSHLDSMRQQRGLMSFMEDDTTANEGALNEKALKVIKRVQDKLTGTDFLELDGNVEPLDVEDQVQRLIVQATSSENLSQLFIGW